MTYIVHVHGSVHVHVGQQIQTKQQTNTASGHLYSDIYLKICTTMYILDLYRFFSLLFNLPLLLHSRLKKIRRDMACFGNYMTVYFKKNPSTSGSYNVKYEHSFWQLHRRGRGGRGVGRGVI